MCEFHVGFIWLYPKAYPGLPYFTVKGRRLETYMHKFEFVLTNLRWLSLAVLINWWVVCWLSSFNNKQHTCIMDGYMSKVELWLWFEKDFRHMKILSSIFLQSSKKFWSILKAREIFSSSIMRQRLLLRTLLVSYIFNLSCNIAKMYTV